MAKLCVEGLNSTYAYCDKHAIPYDKCGKLVVAHSELEIKRLEELFLRAKQNEVPDIVLLESEAQIKEIEPHCHGLKAIHSPHTGIVNWAQVAEHYGKIFEENGGKIHMDFNVTSIDANADSSFPLRIKSANNEAIDCNYILTCAGLFSDRVAALTDCSPEPKIVPFRGEYLLLSPEKSKLVRGNIYPVPDPAFPFLGVHFTPRLNGEVWLGPNAVLAFKREGYRWSDVSLKDLKEILTYPGFYRLAVKYVKFGSMEMVRSAFISLTVKELQKYIPDISVSDIQRGPAGVRAQAMNVKGDLVGDFIFDSGPPGSALEGRVLHCRNAPSPGATSSLAIARMLANKMEDTFTLPKRSNAILY